jgi:hypothetical protein
MSRSAPGWTLSGVTRLSDKVGEIRAALGLSQPRHARAAPGVMIEQLTMAPYRAAQLQTQAAETKSLEAAQVFNTAAARLLAEFRKTALALQTDRAKSLALTRAERDAAQTARARTQTGGRKTAKGGQR